MAGFDHFLAAQAAIYDEALGQLRAGAKRSHWMWFIFPQLAGLGHSAMAQRFALANQAEAAAYLAHPVLGSRLIACTEAVLPYAGRRPVSQIFGYPDDLKFCSSMTLFAKAAPDTAVFQQALDGFFDGREDAETLRRL